MEQTMFPLPEPEEPTEKAKGGRKARVNRPNRGQTEWRAVNLDSLLPEDHQVRLVWEWVMGLDLECLYVQIRAVEGEVGRTAIDPAILVALWFYATLEGVGSARQLERLCQEHLAYQWLCGGVSVNYHTLADFRVENAEFLEHLLVKSIATLQKEGLVQIKQVAQDGKKIRASAGSNSFHRKETLDRHMQQAQEQVDRLRQELEENPASPSQRQKEAQKRAARERLERLEAAKEQMEALEKQDAKTGRDKKNRRTGKERRVSETDPQARVMKMANGGFSPAYNAQFCTDTGAQMILDVQVSQQGNDTGLAGPTLDRIAAQYGKRPEETLNDTGYYSGEEIVSISQKGCTPYMAIPARGKQKQSAGIDPRYQVRPSDPPEVAALRERMSQPEAKEKLVKRGAVAELVHAVMDQCHLDRVKVRGVQKVRTVLLWFVLVHNWMREQFLRKKIAAVAGAA